MTEVGEMTKRQILDQLETAFGGNRTNRGPESHWAHEKLPTNMTYTRKLAGESISFLGVVWPRRRRGCGGLRTFFWTRLRAGIILAARR